MIKLEHVSAATIISFISYLGISEVFNTFDLFTVGMVASWTLAGIIGFTLSKYLFEREFSDKIALQGIVSGITALILGFGYFVEINGFIGELFGGETVIVQLVSSSLVYLALFAAAHTLPTLNIDELLTEIAD